MPFLRQLPQLRILRTQSRVLRFQFQLFFFQRPDCIIAGVILVFALLTFLVQVPADSYSVFQLFDIWSVRMISQPLDFLLESFKL